MNDLTTREPAKDPQDLEAIHEFFTKLQVTGFGPEKRKFEFGEQIRLHFLPIP